MLAETAGQELDFARPRGPPSRRGQAAAQKIRSRGRPIETRETPPETEVTTRGRADLALVRRVLAGDAEASGTFVERMRCVPRILAFRNARMGRPLSDHDLADVAQDVLVSLWSKLADFEGRGSLEAWAYAFCFQELMNHIRRKRRTPLPQGGDCTVSEPATEQNPSAELERSETELLLRNISAREAEVVRMRLFEELEMRDVAEQLQISLSSAKTHYYRALEKLRPLLADGLEAGDR